MKKRKIIDQASEDDGEGFTKRTNNKLTICNLHLIKAFIIYLDSIHHFFMITECFDFSGHNITKLHLKLKEWLRGHKKSPEAFIEYDRLLHNGMPDFQNQWATAPTLGFFVDWKVFQFLKFVFLDNNRRIGHPDILAAIITVLTNLNGDDLEDAITRGLINRDMKCIVTYTAPQCTRFLHRHHIINRSKVECNIWEGHYVPITEIGMTYIKLIGNVCYQPKSQNDEFFTKKSRYFVIILNYIIR